MSSTLSAALPALPPALLPTLSFLFLTATGVMVVLPQLLRVLRLRDATGLSTTALLAGSVNYTAWDVYLLDEGELLLLATNLLTGAVWYALTFATLWHLPTRRLPRRTWWVVGGWGLLVMAVVIAERPALGALLGLGCLVSALPQAVGVWTAPSLGGISSTGWVVGGIAGAVWLVQSLGSGLVGGTVYGVVALAASASVLLALRVRGTAPGVGGPPPEPETPGTGLALAA